jgi:hypothetical protein
MMAVLLSACTQSASSGDLDIEILDIDTPQPKEKFAYFTVVVTRIGEQAGGIGWHASGEINLRVFLEGDMPLNAAGTGVGTAGFDASSNNCLDMGGWPIEYTAEGNFDDDTCTLTLKIEEIWPRTEAYAVCFGVSGSGSGGMYQLSFPTLLFEDDDPREDTETTRDMITWINSFLLYPKSDWQGSKCVFDTPES